MPTARLLCSVLALAALTGCYTNARGEALEQRVLTIEARQDEFRTTFDSDREQLSELALRAEASVSDLQAALDSAQDFLQRTNADLGVRVDGLEEQLSELRGRLEEGAFQAAQLRQELELLRQDIEIQLGGLLAD